MAGRAITPGKTLVFFDEIQECPRAITSLRYFKEKLPKLHVVAAGSLLEFALGAISFPVGRVEYEFLYPLSFREFLTGTGRTQLASFLPQPLQSQLSPPVVMAKALNAALREYMVVGGMPEAVAVYAKTQSLVETGKIHDRIARSFRDDIPKYVSGDLQAANISNLFARLPRFCGQQVTYTKLHDDDPKRNKLSLNLLRQAFIVHFVSAASPASLPLGASANENSFKPIFLDIGLAQRLCGRMPTEVINSREIVSAFDGQLAEQFVGQQLLALSSGSESGSLYYWKRHEKSSSAEVDYLLSREGKIIPLEVKNGKSGSLKSLHLLLKTYPNVKRAICLQDTDQVTTSDRICFAPLYSEL
jgi:predicted AAA+ superfamily ATPase